MSNRIAIAACAASLLSPCISFAADDLAAVVVTATRFSEKALDAPIGIRILTAEDIRRSTATTLGEVLTKFGGVHTRINFLGLPDSPLDLRGSGMTGDQNTLVLIDGVRISENEQAPARISAIPLNAIERIEILPGSGAVLYGSGATGGVINIITRAAAEQPVTGLVFASAGSYGARELRGSIAGGSNGWGISLNANRADADNYRANNASSLENANVELRREADSGWLALRLGDDRQQARLPGARTEAQLSSDPRGTDTPNDYARLKGTRWGLAGEQRFGDIALSFDLGLRDKNSNSFNESIWGTSLVDTDVHTVSFSPRLKWNSAPGDRENVLIAGIDAATWNYRTRWQATGFLSNRDEKGDQHNFAVYVQDQLRVTQDLRLSVGARSETIRQSSEEFTAPLPVSERRFRLSASEIGLRYQLSSPLALYARAGTSFRVANIDDNRCFFAPCSMLLEPQTSHDREAGVEWQQGKSKLRASVFESHLTNEIYYNNLTFTNQNLSPTRRRGVELEGRTTVAQDWDINARYAYTEARFDEGIYGGIDVTGKTVPLVPRHRVTLNLGWQARSDTRLTLSARHVGEQVYDNDPANLFHRMPGYTLLDTKIARSFGAFKLAAGINNLTDKRYYSYALTDSSTAPTRFNAYPETPRTVYLTAEYLW
ncbi:MAG: TonB-dependent receptor [Sulfuritalea sp.]|jgi:iron complex outermembrane receptor protein|nr:TonB-dependent receptor [Sulfuritalea sp.]